MFYIAGKIELSKIYAKYVFMYEIEFLLTIATAGHRLLSYVHHENTFCHCIKNSIVKKFLLLILIISK